MNQLMSIIPFVTCVNAFTLVCWIIAGNGLLIAIYALAVVSGLAILAIERYQNAKSNN